MNGLNVTGRELEHVPKSKQIDDRKIAICMCFGYRDTQCAQC